MSDRVKRAMIFQPLGWFMLIFGLFKGIMIAAIATLV